MHTTKENDPVLSREEALSILNTPDDQLDDLIPDLIKIIINLIIILCTILPFHRRY